MFCGWSAYEQRLHIVAEGESGHFYQLAPAPWGDFTPFGDLERHHYDPFVNHAHTIAASVLEHTKHEPIERVFVIEQSWSKKFNLPDRLWDAQYTEAKDPHSYFHLRQVISPEGDVLSASQNWMDYQIGKTIGENPRLWRDSRKGRTAWEVRSVADDTLNPSRIRQTSLIVE